MEKSWKYGDSLNFETPLPDFLKEAPLRVKNSFVALNSVGIDSDIRTVSEAANDVNEYISNYYANKSIGMSATTLSPRDLVGYEAAGSVLRRLYPNVFQVNAFVGENYWVSSKCRKELWKEVDRDGFVLKSTNKSKSHIRKALRFLDNLDATSNRDIDYLRNKLRDNLAVFGNLLVYRYKDNKKGYKQERMNVLLMEKTQPMFIRDMDIIESWQYFLGYRKVVFTPEELDHIYTFSARSNVMGQPPMSPLIVDIEAAMHSSVYSNTVMQKGGLLRGILALKDLTNGQQVINDKTYIDLAEELSRWYDRRFSGVRGSGALAVGPFIDKFIDLNKIGEMDMAWVTLNDKVALRTCGAFGVPPGRVNITLGSQYKNNAEILDSVALGFDNEIYYTTGLIHKYLNKVLEENGYEDVRIEPKGEFSSISKSAAEFLHYITMAYKNSGCLIMTVNEFRTRILRWEAIDDPIGDLYIGEIMSADDPRKLALQAAGSPQSNKKRFEDDYGIITYCPKSLRYFS